MTSVLASPSPPSPGGAKPSPTATAASPQEALRIQRAAQDFEAMALGQMLAPMFQTVDSSKGAFGGGAGEEAWKPMMVTELGKQVAKAGGVGLARPVMEQMLRLQEARNEAGDGSAGISAARSRPERATPERTSLEQTPVEQLLLERPALRRTTAQQLAPRPGA